MDLIGRILSNCPGLRLVRRSCLTSPAPESCLSTFVEVAGTEKIQRARQDKRGNFSL